MAKNPKKRLRELRDRTKAIKEQMTALKAEMAELSAEKAQLKEAIAAAAPKAETEDAAEPETAAAD